MEGSVLVIGGGIAGIQASLDLTEIGFKVYLVEKTPSIDDKHARFFEGISILVQIRQRRTARGGKAGGIAKAIAYRNIALNGYSRNPRKSTATELRPHYLVFKGRYIFGHRVVKVE